MTQRIDRKTFEVDVDYSLLNEQTNAEINSIRNGLHNPNTNQTRSGWWTHRWTPYVAAATGCLVLAMMFFGFWNLHNKIDAATLSTTKLANSNNDLLTRHVTREHHSTRSLLSSIAEMIADLEAKIPPVDSETRVEPTGPDWKEKYEDLNKRYEDVQAELDVANGKIANIAGLPKSAQPSIKRSVTVFNTRMIDGREVVTGWNFDSVSVTKPSSEYCYLQVLSGKDNISVRFDIMINKQKVNFPNSDMRKYGVTQSQLDRARSACIWHTGEGA